MKSHKGFAKGYLIVLIFLVILLLGIGYLFRNKTSSKTTTATTNEVSGSVTVKPAVTVKKTTPKKTTPKKTVIKSPTTTTTTTPSTPGTPPANQGELFVP